MQIASVILWFSCAYAMGGVLFALAFVTVGVSRVDPAARGAGVFFRLLLIPGCAALWPVLVVKWIRAGEGHE